MREAYYKKDSVHRVYLDSEHRTTRRLKVTKVNLCSDLDGYYYFYEMADAKTGANVFGLSENMLTVSKRNPLAIAFYVAGFDSPRVRQRFHQALITPDAVS